MKNKGCIVAVAVAVGLLVIALAVGGWFVGKYNTMVELRSGTAGYEKTWADVESQYQRRADLIPNLVATVKGYAAHEEKTLTEVVEARAKATQANIDASSLTPEALEKFQAAQGQLSQAQLEGTENRIAVARQRFNEAASKYNAYIMKFPGNIIAGITGFKEAALFKADQGASEAPKVEF